MNGYRYEIIEEIAYVIMEFSLKFVGQGSKLRNFLSEIDSILLGLREAPVSFLKSSR